MSNSEEYAHRHPELAEGWGTAGLSREDLFGRLVRLEAENSRLLEAGNQLAAALRRADENVTGASTQSALATWQEAVHPT